MLFRSGLQLPAGTDLSHIGFPTAAAPAPGDLLQHDKKKAGKKKAAAAGLTPAVSAAQLGATAGLLDSAGYPYIPGNGFPAAAGGQPAGQPVVDLDSETDSNHDTALTLACAGGHEELVNLLLSRGADIEHRDKKGFTPLILAATAGHDKVRILTNMDSVWVADCKWATHPINKCKHLHN